MYFSLFAIFLFASSFSIIQVEAADDRTKLEAEMVNPSTGKDDGKAKFEQKEDRTTFSVEIEDQNSNSAFKIRVDGEIIGTFMTDDSGFADFNLDDRDGDEIPLVTSGSIVEVIDSNQNVILYGQMIGINGIQETGSPAPTTDSEPVSTTSVIIPFGAKDKDVSEFYVPNTISVGLSETITWTNQDDADHTVTSKTSGIFNSGIFGANQSFSHQFTVDGTYDYFCQLHPWMIGTVIAGKGGDVSTQSEPTPTPSDPTPTPTPLPTPTPSNSSPLQYTIIIPIGAAEQTITEFYLPSSMSIKVSDSILWQNSDIGFHTVTSGKGSSDGFFDSGLYGPGESFSHQFTSVGTFDYFCFVHPWMTGKVLVNPVDSSIEPVSQPIPTPIEPTLPSTPQELQPDFQPAPEPNRESKVLDVIIPQGSALQTVEEYYVPSKISINTTDSIIWKNQDEGFHTVTSNGGEIFDSGLYGPAESFSFQFNKPGNFDYYCVVHPWMIGSVLVTGKEKIEIEQTKIILSPLKQMKKGIMAKDIQCKTGYDLIVKTSKDLGACVKPTSLLVLVQRGWGL